MDTAFDRPVDPQLVQHALATSRFAPFWLDTIERPDHPRLEGDIDCDLVIVGGGYLGLWTALQAIERDPGAKIVLVEAVRIGWAASGRNGGFVEASITHGFENGSTRWPDEIDELERLGHENLQQIDEVVTRDGLDVDWEYTGVLTVATEPHQVDWLHEGAVSGPGRFLDLTDTRAMLDSPTYLAGLYEPKESALVHPAKLAMELARVAAERGVQLFERTKAIAIETDGGASAPVRVVTTDGTVTAGRAVLATNVFPSLLKRNRLMTVPVYDYVLATEPLSDAQLASIGWQDRMGVTDSANQFHYYRLTADNRIVWGGYDAVYHYGGRVKPEYERRPESYEKLAAHFFQTFPQLEGLKFSHRWAGAIDTSTRFCAHYGLAREGRVAYANGFTGLGVGATRFAADVLLDLLLGLETERTSLRMVRELPPPFPPEPFASAGIQATRWSLDRADHNAGRRNALLKTLDALGLGFDS